MANEIEKNIGEDVVLQTQTAEFNLDYVRQVSTAAYDMRFEIMKTTGSRGKTGL